LRIARSGNPGCLKRIEGSKVLQEVRDQTEQWLKKNDHDDALGDMTPREILLTHKPEISINSWS
jgi:hypothetical protein